MKKTLPKWVTDSHSRANLIGLKDELRKLHIWTEGYNAGKGSPTNTIPGSGILGGTSRAIALVNKLLEADNL